MTEEERKIESYLSELKAKDPQFDLKAELGQLLMKHIDDLTFEERMRYKELKRILNS